MPSYSLVKSIGLFALLAVSQTAWGTVIIADNLASTQGQGTNVGFTTGGGDNYACGQTFLATTGGELNGLTVGLSRQEAQHDLTVGIYATTAGNPTGAPLIERTFAQALIPTETSLVEFDFTASGVVFTQGDTYAFIMYVPTPHTEWQYGVAYDFGASYTGGSRVVGTDGFNGPFFATNDGDLTFEVTVIPEPASLGLFLLGSLGIGLMRRSRRA